MARVAAILKALARAMWCAQKSAGSLASNNFFLLTAYFLEKAGAFVYLVLGLILLFPLSGDPLRKVPPERLASWPLSKVERAMLRMLSPWANPMTWLLAAVVVWAARRAVSAGVLALAAIPFAAAYLAGALPAAQRDTAWRVVPAFPGRLGQLIRKDLRQMLSMLDFCCALVLSVCGAVYRVFNPAAPPDAWMALSLLIVLALAGYAQCLFGLDGEAGLRRCRLLPVSGWQLLAAKDAALLTLSVALTLPLAPVAGLAAALVALAVGHAPSVRQRRPQTRWRFTSAGAIGNGLLQAVLLIAAGVNAFRTSALVLVPCVAGWAASLWWFGRAWDAGE